jgi:hypothetical protein
MGYMEEIPQHCKKECCDNYGNDYEKQDAHRYIIVLFSWIRGLSAKKVLLSLFASRP